MTELASGKVVGQRAHQVSVIDHRLVRLDWAHKMSRRDQMLRIADPHKIAEVGSLENRMLVENHNGSYRTAREAS